jgi:hypothetical protein
MASLFSDAQIADLHEGRAAASRTFVNLCERYLIRGYKDARAEEHAQHGFSRRLGTLIRAVNLGACPSNWIFLDEEQAS